MHLRRKSSALLPLDFCRLEHGVALRGIRMRDHMFQTQQRGGGPGAPSVETPEDGKRRAGRDGHRLEH